MAELPVVVIGAGIGGLATSIGLSRVGIQTTLYEQAPQLKEVGAGISLWSNAMRALDWLGVGDSVRSVANPVLSSEFRTHSGHRVARRIDLATYEHRCGLPPTIHLVHRHDLVSKLAAHVAPEAIHFSRRLQGIEVTGQPERSYRLQFESGEQAVAKAVIGADGLRSSVRGFLLGPEALRYSGYTCWRGLCKPDSPLIKNGYLAEFWGRGARFGITSLPNQEVYWWATKNRMSDSTPELHLDELQQTFQHWGEPVPQILSKTSEDAITRYDIHDRYPIKHWSRGAVGLAGDAAHPMTPNLGQGGCLAIEDAVILARCAAGGSNFEEVFLSFQRCRKKRADEVQHASERFGRIGQLSSFSLTTLRDAALKWHPERLFLAELFKFCRYDASHVQLPTIAGPASITSPFRER